MFACGFVGGKKEIRWECEEDEGVNGAGEGGLVALGKWASDDRASDEAVERVRVRVCW